MILEWIELIKVEIGKLDIASEKSEMESSNFEEIQKISEADRASISAFTKVGRTETNGITIWHSESITDRKSKFQAHCCLVETEGDVQQFVQELKKNKKIADGKKEEIVIKCERI